MAEKATETAIGVAMNAEKRVEFLKTAEEAGNAMKGAVVTVGSVTATAAAAVGSATMSGGKSAGRAAAASASWAASFAPEAMSNLRPKM